MICDLAEMGVSGLLAVVTGLIIWYLAKWLFPHANLSTMRAHVIMLFVLGVGMYSLGMMIRNMQ